MNFWDVFEEMLVILFAILAGYLAKRLHYLSEETDEQLSKLLLNITNPCMIVGSVLTGSALPENRVILSILFASVLFYGLELVMTLFLPRLLGGPPEQQGIWKFVLTFPNTGFIGYPVVVSIFGKDALFYAVVLCIPFNLLAYTLGPLMLSGKSRFDWKQFFTPCIVASVIALVIALSRVQLPPIFGDMANMIGDVTIPLALMLVGSILAKLPLREMLGSVRVWSMVAIRLLAMPGLLTLLLMFIPMEPTLRAVTIVEMAMPSALNGTMLCITYGGDQRSMAQVTFLSTLASIVTIPAVTVLLL